MKLLKLTEEDFVLEELNEGPGLLRLDNGHDLMVSAPDLDGIEIVRVEFPEFKHGQAFTQARLLRERYGFKGEIRAGGKLFRDQAWHARRCGIDAFEVEEDAADGFLKSLTAYPYHYQPAVTGVPAWRLRA